MQYDMVFEGGGAKGMVFVGALQELKVRDVTPARLLGTSAGSIMATFLAAGYSTEEMSAALSEEKDGKPVFLGFLETPPPLSEEEIQKGAIRTLLRAVDTKLIPDFAEDKLDDALASALSTSRATRRLASFIERGGFYAADFFLEWLREKLNTGTYTLERGNHPKGAQRAFGGMTMAEFFEAVGADLSLVAADTTDNQLLILNHRTAPDLPVIYGVRMSMSVPLLWHEVIWQPEWGLYRGKDISGNTVVDGGLLSNFPIELFLSDQPQVTAVMGTKTTAPEMVLGFLIDEKAEVPGAPPGKGGAMDLGFEVGQLRTVERISGLMNTMIQAHDKSVMDIYEHLVVRLPAKGYGTIEFDMSTERREALVNAGRQATVDFFKRAEAATPGVLSGAASLAFTGPSPVSPQETADRVALRILSD
jgi:predicted acylesterase/phospholipase RssA